MNPPPPKGERTQEVLVDNSNPSVPAINVERLNTAALTVRKTYIDLPNEVIYLALNCDLRSRAETCVNAKSINALTSFISATQKGLDKVSQMIISLDEIAANQNEFSFQQDDENSLDEMEALQNAFHGEPEIEATATLTELIQLEPENRFAVIGVDYINILFHFPPKLSIFFYIITFAPHFFTVSFSSSDSVNCRVSSFSCIVYFLYLQKPLRVFVYFEKSCIFVYNFFIRYFLLHIIGPCEAELCWSATGMMAQSSKGNFYN